MDGTTLNSGEDSFTTDHGYNLFGETETVSAKYNENIELYRAEYTRDKLGRIETKTETVEGVETLYEYGYDLAGRLETVKQNADVAEQ